MRLEFAKVAQMIGLEGKFISSNERKLLSPQEIEPGITLPKHLVIIPDGNRRWAKLRRLPASEGHREGVKTAKNLMRACQDWKIQTLTIWGISTDNIEKRSPQEVNTLFLMFEKLFTDKKILNEWINEGTKVKFIGRQDRIGENRPSLLKAIKEVEEKTKGNQKSNLVFGLDYGGRDELVRAFRDIAIGIKDGTLKPDEIDEKLISLHLDTAGLKDPDLIIRTSGEQRTSGMLIYQGALAELYFYDQNINFPDLTPELLREALLDFGQRQRRLGG